MSTQSKTIKFLKGWNGHSVGEIWTPDMQDQANLLVINGKAEYVDPPTPEIKFREPQSQQRPQQQGKR